MSFWNDKIKVLEIICANMLPFDIQPEPQLVTLTDDDFLRNGLTIVSADLVLKEIALSNYVKTFSSKPNNTGRTLEMTVDSGIEWYLKQLKYPETEFIDEHDYVYSNQTSVVSKTVLILDKKRGIYKKDNLKYCYSIKHNSKRMAVLFLVIQKDRVSVSEIKKETNQTETLVMKEIKALNGAFRKKLVITDDLIIRLETGGYSLNKDKFDLLMQS